MGKISRLATTFPFAARNKMALDEPQPSFAEIFAKAGKRAMGGGRCLPPAPVSPRVRTPSRCPPRACAGSGQLSCSWGPDAGALPVVARVVSRCPSPPGRVKGVKHLAVYPWWATRLGTPPLPPSTARMGGFVCYIRSLSPQFTSSAQRAGCVKAGGQVDALSTLHPTGPGPRPSPSLDLTRGGIDSQRRAFAKYWTASL